MIAAPTAARESLPWTCRAPLLQIENLGVCYGKKWALRGVDLDIWQGDLLAFIGPNGAGKSTLLKALLGLVPLAEGRIVKPARSPRIGYVPQKLALDAAFPLTVEEFLAINHPGSRVWLGGVPKSQRPAIDEALEKLGAAPFARQLVGTLSGGQFQRVLLAAALLQNPEVLLLDEPSASIDRRGSEELQLLLHDLHAQLNLTLIFVSHDLHFVSHLATRVGCLNQSFCGLGPPHEVLSEHFLMEAYGSAVAPGSIHFHPHG
jgi:ABC-type Mn2+/Zn2+ transport system ATPase subunit